MSEILHFLAALSLPTLRACSILASCAYALTFLVAWSVNRRDAHFLCWSVSSAIYALALVGFANLARSTNVFVDLTLYGVLALSNALIVAGLRAFDGMPPFARWMVAMTVGVGALHATPTALEHAGWPVSSALRIFADTAALGASMAITGMIVLRARQFGRTRVIIGIALLAYLPGYGAALVAQLAFHTKLLSALPLVLDQLLLGALNLGLFAVCVERAQTRLKEAALRDALTGAWNRAGLAFRTRHFVAAGTGIVAIDVDHFKAINDRYGHATGDRVLIALVAVASRLAAPLGGEIVRLGGDEFVVVLPNAGPETAARFAGQLGRAGQASQSVPAWTISLGITIVLPDECDLAPALARADASLYAAKNTGRNRAWTWRSGDVLESAAA